MVDPQFLIVIAMATVFLLSVGAFALIFNLRHAARSRFRRRVTAIIGGGHGAVDKTVDSSAARRRLMRRRLNEAEDRAKRSRRRNVMRNELQQSGLTVSMRGFVVGSIVFGAVVGVLVAWAGVNGIVAGLVAVAAGLAVPRRVLRYLGRRRRKRFTLQFSGAVDIIVRGVQSGLPVDECFNIIARESPDPLGHEFRLIIEGQRLGLSLEETLSRAYERTPTPDLKFFATVLSIQRQTGGNLAETLTNLSELLRDRQRMVGRVKALSSEARASAMIIASLPVVVGSLLLIVNPKYIALLFSDPIGNVMIGAGLLIMTVGTLIMKKMVNFEI